jgi:hypothetical protein
LGNNDNNIKNNIDNNSIKKVPTNSNSYISNEVENENLRLSLGLLNHRRISSRNIKLIKLKSKSINSIKINPSILKSGIKSNRKSCLPVINVINLKKNVPQSNTKNKNDSKTLINPKEIVKPKPIKEMYEKINKTFFAANKKLKNIEKVNELLKEFYGDKMKEYNKSNSVDCYDVYNIYHKIKGKIMLYERNNEIYTHYKELIPDIMANKISTIKEQDEKLKKYPVNYFKTICKKKFIEEKDV